MDGVVDACIEQEPKDIASRNYLDIICRMGGSFFKKEFKYKRAAEELEEILSIGGIYSLCYFNDMYLESKEINYVINYVLFDYLKNNDNIGTTGLNRAHRVIGEVYDVRKGDFSVDTEFVHQNIEDVVVNIKKTTDIWTEFRKIKKLEKIITFHNGLDPKKEYAPIVMRVYDKETLDKIAENTVRAEGISTLRQARDYFALMPEHIQKYADNVLIPSLKSGPESFRHLKNFLEQIRTVTSYGAKNVREEWLNIVKECHKKSNLTGAFNYVNAFTHVFMDGNARFRYNKLLLSDDKELNSIMHECVRTFLFEYLMRIKNRSYTPEYLESLDDETEFLDFLDVGLTDLEEKDKGSLTPWQTLKPKKKKKKKTTKKKTTTNPKDSGFVRPIRKDGAEEESDFAPKPV